ncbi:DUF4153 domain-containing protein [uncultured Oxalicibacterium sp.]|uniref:DUF4153 domain-containing protein n=1 Tax=uncultured Oxalicibacterium sp. TaxID=1168540 RepID=UPI0025EBC178|nr:DUF4153 domain-containing protein [uncultured Oxalicibacterium sp.]
MTQQDTSTAQNEDTPAAVARWRLFAGLLQGGLLYALYYSLKQEAGLASNAYVFLTLFLLALFVPLLFVSAFGHLTRGTLLRWLLCASLVCVALAVGDVWRMDFVGNWKRDGGNVSRFLSDGWLLLATAAGFFIAQAMILAGARDGRRLPSYPACFEAAWKLGIQFAFALPFVGLLWLILWLGATLFMLVKLSFLRTLLDQAWFVIPVLAFAFSVALHVTDVRPRIVQGIRGLLLTLLSWLLPLSVLLVGGFLLTLPFIGLEPLWATRHATTVLLSAAGVLIVLINATFQQGEVTQLPPRILQLAARIACVLLLPLVVIASHALTLRVGQYGWSADRITAVACLLVATAYAIGYLWAACERGWLTRIAQTNVLTALWIVLILLVLFTPLADPARLSVNSQMARLEAGKVSAAEFDFHYLRFEGARYGNTALQELKSRSEGSDAETLRKGAEAALAKTNKWDRSDALPALSAATRQANITVYPKGRALPADFMAQDWMAEQNSYILPECLRRTGRRCEAWMLDMNADGREEILIADASPNQQLILFAREEKGWRSMGWLSLPQGCGDLLKALREGHAHAVTPRFQDLDAGGTRLTLQTWGMDANACNK